MIFRMIHIKEGFAERLIDFTSGVNLIHSEKNSRGKTTLLRFMLYSLGYNIPNTRKIKFDRCEVTANLSCEKCGEITLFRCSNSYMSLYEQQSDFNPNMPLRGMIYFADLYGKYIEECRRNIYGHRLVQIPTPKYVVFYIGDEKHQDVEKLRLSDAFIHSDESGEFEWTATMIALSPGQNEELLEKCRPLKEYTIFVNTLKYKIKTMTLEDAVEETIKECIAQGILTEFLKAHRAEVLMSCITEFNKEVYEMDIREEGRLENLHSNIKNLMESLEISVEEACKLLKVEEKEYEYIKSLIK